MEKKRVIEIFSLSLPIMGGMVSQNILNLVDIYFVKSLGETALAASGLGGFASFASVALILGLSTGVQALSSRRKGEGDVESLAKPLNTGLFLALFSGVILSFFLYQLVPTIYPYINNDPDVIEAGSSYLQVRLAGITFIGINFAFRGFWNGISLSKMYMKTLLVMHVVNVIANYMLIFGNWGAPKMGLDGAAWGTNISLACGTAIYFLLGFRVARNNGFLRSLPSLENIKQMVTLSLPSGVQQLFFASGLLVFYWIVGKIGTSELAAANVLTNVMLVAILPAMGLGLGAASLVGQALGRKDFEDAMQWGWDVMKVGSIVIGVIGLPMLISPHLVLSPFAPDEKVLGIAALPLRITGLYIFLDGMGLVLMHALLGAGATSQVMKVSLSMQWLIFLPAAYLLVTFFSFGFLEIWVFQGFYRLVQGAIFARIWRSGTWSKIRI